jgi:hypothetical protein
VNETLKYIFLSKMSRRLVNITFISIFMTPQNFMSIWVHITGEIGLHLLGLSYNHTLHSLLFSPFYDLSADGSVPNTRVMLRQAQLYPPLKEQKHEILDLFFFHYPTFSGPDLYPDFCSKSVLISQHIQKRTRISGYLKKAPLVWHPRSLRQG